MTTVHLYHLKHNEVKIKGHSLKICIENSKSSIYKQKSFGPGCQLIENAGSGI
jgi:hypothetical protein